MISLSAHSSFPGLTRQSIKKQKTHIGGIDCRVKPGNDDEKIRREKL